MSIFDQEHLAGEEPGHPSPPLKAKPRPGLLLLALVLVTVLGAGILVGGGYIVTRVFGGGGASSDYSGSGEGKVTIEVKQGDSASAIGKTLVANDVVKSTSAFTDAAADDDASQSIQPGFYNLRKHMQGTSALALMLDPASIVKTKVVIPEGFTLAQTLARISKEASIPMADLQAAVKDPTTIGLPRDAQGRVEGFLFPATYDFGPGTTAVAALSQMTRRFGQLAVDVDLDAKSRALGRSPLQVIIIASLLEREGKNPDDFGKISRVISNRLTKNIKLGLESTVRYALGAEAGAATRLLQSQLDAAAASPYDTYTHAGLPPGPIGNPGQAAIQAALAPTPGDWLYFVTLPKEGNVFTASESEFTSLVAKCHAEGGC